MDQRPTIPAAAPTARSLGLHPVGVAQRVGGAAGPDAIGYSKLCYLLAGIGLSLSTASGLCTNSLLQEQQESLAAAVVDHIAPPPRARRSTAPWPPWP